MINIKTYFRGRLPDKSYFLLLISASLVLLVIRSIYVQNQTILKSKLQERLVAITSTAAIELDPETIDSIRTEKDLESEKLRTLVQQMLKVKEVNKDIRFIYIWRKTNDPNYLEFVADGEMLNPIDDDQNGIIENEEIPPVPGERYDVSQIPESKDLFNFALAQEDFIVDKWGTFLSGYSPIYDKKGEAIAVLGIDVEVSDFNKLIRATFIPFALLTCLLLVILCTQTVLLVRIWKGRVKVFQELDRQKTELLAIVSHQLAKPITALKWEAESLLDGDLGVLAQKQQDEIKRMHAQSVNLADLVSTILDVSHIQLGKVDIKAQPLELKPFFSEIVDIVRPTIAEKAIRFVETVPAHLPTVLLDKRYTRMTIENLLTNAVKYTPQNGAVTFEVTINEENIMRVRVADTGVGIPKDEQSKIFGKMYRASNVRNAAAGNGFGLYVAKGAIEAQGGSLWFTSVEGKGTSFFVDLPLKIASTEQVRG